MSSKQPVSRRPYLLRAMHEWISDSEQTPHVVVDAEQPQVDVPRQYVKDGKITRAAVAVPFADELKFGALYAELAKGGVPALSTLMASHNGHPYLLLNLLLALTLHFGWSWSWMMYAQVPVLVLAFWVVLRNLADSTGGGAWPFVAAVGIACSLVTVRLWENLYWGMQISAALCFLFTVLCFDAAARYLRGVGDPRQVVVDPDAGYFGGRLEELSLVPLGEVLLGGITLDSWLQHSKRSA